MTGVAGETGLTGVGGIGGLGGVGGLGDDTRCVWLTALPARAMLRLLWSISWLALLPGLRSPRLTLMGSSDWLDWLPEMAAAPAPCRFACPCSVGAAGG